LKILLAFFALTQLTVSAQPRIKKILIEGHGSPIVMLAGGTVDMTALAIPSKELSVDYKVIRMENFNVQYASEGLTLPNNYSVRVESEGIKFTLDSLKITEPIVLLGHSYGGLIALDFALNHPSRVLALILIEPPVFDMAKAKNESPKGMKEMQMLTKELTSKANITEGLVERFRCELLNCDSISIRQLPQWQTWVQQKNRLRGLSAVGEYKLDLNKIHRFQKPVLIITGTNTVVFHKRIDELLAKEFHAATSVSIQSGHAIPSTAPIALVASVRNFIESIGH